MQYVYIIIFFNLQLNPSDAEVLQQRIQKLIVENSAIIDGVEPPLQKKYHKITGINRSISHDSSSSTSNAPVRPTRVSRDNQNLQIPMTITPNNIVIVTPKTPTVQNCAIQLPYPPQLIHQAPSTPHSVQIIQQPVMLTTAPPHSHSHNQTQHQQQPQQQSHQQHQIHHHGPLNLATNKLTNDSITEDLSAVRKRKISLEQNCTTPQELVTVVDHPQNPERSIIKDLLLNSRTFGVVAEGESTEALFVCHTCKKGFQTAELLKYHTVCHCDGNNVSGGVTAGQQSPQSAPISPVASPHQYIRSNSIHLSLPESNAASPSKGGRMERIATGKEELLNL